MRRSTAKSRMGVEIVNRQRRVRIDKPRIAALAAKTLDMENAAGDVSIACVGRRTIIELNKRFFGKETDTDVIAFPLRDDSAEGGAYIGEVVVCGDVAADEAEARGLDPQDELFLYTVHGLLHLLGYTDGTPSSRTKMNRRARAILKHFKSKPR